MAIGLHHDLSSDTISFEDFLRVYDDVHAEWVAGKVVAMSPASDRHQDVVGFLHAVIRPFLRARGLGVVRAGPFVMRLGAAAREPDLLLVRTEHTGRIKPTFLDGAADLVIEVLSPESRTRDTTEKLAEYEAAGVREYWTIDPTRQTATQYRLGGAVRDGAARRAGRAGERVVSRPADSRGVAVERPAAGRAGGAEGARRGMSGRCPSTAEHARG